MITPWWMLAGVTGAIFVILLADRQISRRRARRLRRLAERRGFRFSQIDRFALAKRVRYALPEACGDVTVRDLMYRSVGRDYLYAFTAVYRGGAGGRLVVQARESAGDLRLLDVRRGDASLSLGEQYRRLLQDSTGDEQT